MVEMLSRALALCDRSQIQTRAQISHPGRVMPAPNPSWDPSRSSHAQCLTLARLFSSRSMVLPIRGI